MTLRDDYLDWKVDTLHEPFVDDGAFFRDRYGTMLSPFCKDIFRELMDIQQRLDLIERKERVRDEEEQE